MLSLRDTCNYVFKNSWLNSDFQETKTRTVESTPPVSKPVPRISEGCSSCGRNPQHQQCPQTHAAEDTGHLFHLSLSCLKPLSSSAPPAQTIVFLQTDLAAHCANGSQGTEQTGRVPLWGARSEEYRSAPYSTWAHPWLLSCAQGNGQNLHFKALIKLVADKTPFWQGTAAQQIGSSTQWSGAGKTLLGWWIVTHRFVVGWGGERKKTRNKKKIKIQLTSVYYLSLFNVHSRVPLEIFQMILYLSWLTNVSFDLV